MAVIAKVRADTAAMDGFTWYINVENISKGNVLWKVAKKNVIMNSSNEIIKLKIAPAINPGLIIGRVIYQTAQNFEAPRLLAASSKEILNVWRLAPTVTITNGIVIVKCAGTKAHKLSEIFNWSAILNKPNPSTICGNTIGEIMIAWIVCLPFLGPRSNPKATKVPRTRDNGVTINANVRLRKVAFCQSSE